MRWREIQRECLAIDVGQSLKGEDVVDSLNRILHQVTGGSDRHMTLPLARAATRIAAVM